MAEKKKILLTPAGAAKWAHLQTPKAPFKDERGQTKGDPKYQIDVVFDVTDPAWKAWASDIRAKVDALPDQFDKQGDKLKKQMPIKKELDANDQPTGRFYATFKTGEQFKPGVFDKFKNEITENVGNESTVRVAYTEAVYSAFGGGITLYLSAVQVLELIPFSHRSPDAYGFEFEAAPAGAPAKPGQPEDDLPF